MEIKDVPLEAVGAAAVGIPSFWLFLKKVLLKSAVDSTAITAADAHTEVIKLLRSELDRMHQANTDSVKVNNTLHDENMALRKEIFDLQRTVSQLNDQLKRSAHNHANKTASGDRRH